MRIGVLTERVGKRSGVSRDRTLRDGRDWWGDSERCGWSGVVQVRGNRKN